MRFPRSLQGRLAVSLVVGAGSLLVVAGLALRAVTGARLQGELDAALLVRAQALASLTEQYPEGIEFDFADEVMPEFSRPRDPQYFELWLDDGTVLERSRSLGVRDLPQDGFAETTPSFAAVRLPDGRPGRAVRLIVRPRLEEDEHDQHPPPATARFFQGAGSPSGQVVLVVARSTEPLDSQLRTLSLSLIAMVALLLALLTVLIRVLLRWGLRPLDRVTEQVQALDAESLHSRIEVPSPPEELAPVVGQLNALLERLEEAFVRERRLSSNLAHELRTPLAELRSLAEVGGRWPEDTAAVRSFFDDVREIALQMERMVVDLMELARFDAGARAIVTEEVILADVVTSAWRSLEPTAGSRELHFRCEMPRELRVATDRGKLALMVSNLLANAAAYSPRGGRVFCGAHEERGAVRLSVANRAEALAEDDLPKIFERFWRGDPARTGGRHAGLGLALVRAFAELLGIELVAELGPDRMFEVSLTFPPAPPPASR